MPVFKDEKRGTWYVMAWYRDWTGDAAVDLHGVGGHHLPAEAEGQLRRKGGFARGRGAADHKYIRLHAASPQNNGTLLG